MTHDSHTQHEGTGHTMANASLTVEHVRKEFVAETGPLLVLSDVSLEVKAGQSVAVLGPSGSGKSTLLHIIGTLDRPTSGTVRLGEVEVHDLPERELAQFRNRSIGFIFQDHHLLPELSVLENVLIPAFAKGHVTDDDVGRAELLVERVGLNDRRDHLPSELSGGERGRVAIARALIEQPKLVLADEPTGNLDWRTAESVLELLLQMQKEESTMLVVVTHSLELAARLERRFELVDGRLEPFDSRIVQEGSDRG